MGDRIDHLSREYRHFTLTTDHSLAAVPVYLAFTSEGVHPVDADWHTAYLLTNTNNGDGTYTAGLRVLVGPVDNIVAPGSVPLAVGFYWVWYKAGDNPEQPIVRFDTLEVA